MFRFVRMIVTKTFKALGHYGVVGWLLAILLVVGLVLASRGLPAHPVARSRPRRSGCSPGPSRCCASRDTDARTSDKPRSRVVTSTS